MPSQIISENNLMLLDAFEDYDDDAKSIIPSKKRQLMKKAEREESKKESANTTNKLGLENWQITFNIFYQGWLIL